MSTEPPPPYVTEVVRSGLRTLELRRHGRVELVRGVFDLECVEAAAGEKRRRGGGERRQSGEDVEMGKGGGARTGGSGGDGS